MKFSKNLIQLRVYQQNMSFINKKTVFFKYFTKM